MNKKAKKTCCGEALGSWLKPEFFKALCDPNRLRLLQGLGGGGKPQTVQESACSCAVDLSVVSRHLRQMKDAGVLLSEKKGKEVFYQIDVEHVVQTLRQMADELEACCLTPKKKGKKS